MGTGRALLLAFAVGLFGAGPLRADCPGLAGETLRWIVTTRPGGGYDAYSRLLQPFLERALSARIVIENRPEAGGIVGALAIRDAAPDGRTLGIINASGLLAARAGDVGTAPDPASDFTILASIVSNHVVLFSGRDSGIADVAGLLRVAQTRPIVAGVRDAGSSSFYALPIAAALLGFDYELVTGYVGSAARTLAVMRGEVDIVVATFDSVRGPVRDGELVPLLQLTGAPADAVGSASPDTLDAPRMAGPDGLARQRAEGDDLRNGATGVRDGRDRFGDRHPLFLVRAPLGKKLREGLMFDHAAALHCFGANGRDDFSLGSRRGGQNIHRGG